MSEYSCALEVAADPAVVFARLADLRWLAACVPGIGDVRWTSGEEAVASVDVASVDVVAPAQSLAVRVHVHRDLRQVLWGTPDDAVTGEFHVLGLPDGARALLAVRLGLPGPDDGGIRNGLEVVLERVALGSGYAGAL